MITTAVRSPAVAGTFYPGGEAELSLTIDAMLSGAVARAPERPAPKALVAPHAGYVYSGPVAASAYVHLERVRATVNRVVLLGPAHRARVRGLAHPDVKSMRTPLGDVPVDLEALASLSDLSTVTASAAAHAREHSLEVHLPFLQRTLSWFAVVPLVVGDATPAEVAEVLERLWGGPETLVVVSSDLSHYLPYAIAKSVDERTARSIENLELVDGERACGAKPLNGLIELARNRGLTFERLDLRNSGDTAGSRDEVVGYGSFGMWI